MSSPATMLRGARPMLRSQFFTARPTTFKTAGRFGRRYQSTAPVADAQASIFKRMWDSPVGFKTVHFWAPVMKWALVIAGISDFSRPAEKLSLTQNGALTITGIIWTRWCLIIKPKNYLLAAVNFFLASVGVTQVGRILSWQRSEEGKAAMQQAEDAKNSAVAAANGAKEDIKKLVK